MNISSLNNPLIKEIIKLKQKKYRDLNNLVLIEGANLVNEAIKNKLIKYIITTDINYKYEDKVIYITDNVMKKISDTVNYPSLIAVINKIDNTFSGNKILLLDNISDPGNLGTIIRSAVAFNFDTIVLSNNSIDFYNPKVLRSTAGMIFNINILYDDLEVLIGKLKKDNYQILGTDVRDGKDIKDIKINNKLGLIMGNEANGISDNIKKLCDDNLYIKMNDKVESLNLGVSASILMYEVYNK